MKVLHGWLQSYFEKPIPTAEQLEELFTFHSFEVEGLEKGADTDGGSDVLDVKILPDRAHYALSHAGVALEISAITGQPLKANRIPPSPADTLIRKPEVRIEAPNFCRRYMARYAEIARIAPSNPHAVMMLNAIGQRAINAAVDATNVTMFDCGQPMHIFDADQVKGTIVIRAAKKGEKITLLDGGAAAANGTAGGLADREVELLETDHVIADDNGPIAIAGVKGGKYSGVTDKTTRIIIESANFEPTAVRRTSTRLNLRSEASKRYENEITPDLTSLGMTSVCGLVKHNMPEAAFGPLVDIYPNPVQKRVIELDPKLISNRLGVEVPATEAKAILAALQIEVVDKGPLWQLTIPLNRLDLTIAEDMIEEVGRIYGYEHVKGIVPPPIEGGVEVLPEFYIANLIRNELVGHGFSEVNLYTLVAKGHIETAYPLAKDKAFARANLTDGILACVERNALNVDLLGLDAVKVFELGHVFLKDSEKSMLALGVAQIKKVKGVNGQTIITDILAKLSAVLGTTLEAKPVMKGNCAAVEVDLTPAIQSFKMPATISYTDLGFGPASSHTYKKFSVYPFITRDIAVFVTGSATDEEVWAEISARIATAGATKLLMRHALFDTFQKDGKTSYAFRMIFQADDRTLTDVEAAAIMDAIYSGVRAKGWEVR
ncbi:MAG TPA: phenylalanine--tRNA ligase subunit beta [Candidatus Paceibacterota bacterium]